MKRLCALAIGLSVAFTAVAAWACCGVCGVKDAKKAATTTCALVCKEATMKEGVKEITYNQFMKIRNSGESYVLLDVLGEDSYKAGHIEGAKNLPVSGITKETAAGIIPENGAPVVVYCGSFKCSASTKAAKKLTDLGYTAVLDYKGGLKEWKEKGNELVK